MKFNQHFYLLLFLGFFFRFAVATKPNLVIVLVVDQLSYQTLVNIKPYCTGGLRTLLDKGVVYANAQWPHAMPGTGPGHTSLSSGALPSMHGIIDNSWVDVTGKKIYCDDDNNPESAVISQTGDVYAYGKSAHNIMVDTLSDQLIFQSTSAHTHKAFSISLKSRSGIAMAGHCGTAFWLDDENCFFTSSKAYVPSLPAWLQEFNKTIDTTKTYTWNTTFAFNNPAYQWATQETYRYTKLPSAIGTYIHCDDPEKIVFTPYAHTLLFACAHHCLHTQFPTTSGTFILWLGLSSTDKIGHLYGPNSVEYLDLLYKLDKDLEQFIKMIYELNSPEKTVFLLTADHGSMPIPELIAQKGFKQAQRLDLPTLKHALNSFVEQNFGVAQFIVHIDTPDIYFNQTVYQKMPHQQRKKLISALKDFVKEYPGIRSVWAAEELTKCSLNKDDIRWLFQNQLYPHRSGDLIFQALAYVLPDKFPTGTGHRTPYNYDRQVPLVVYQRDVLNGSIQNSLVYGQQVAPTLAYMLNIPRPSASTFDLLPGIDYARYRNNNNEAMLNEHPFAQTPKRSSYKLPRS